MEEETIEGQPEEGIPEVKEVVVSKDDFESFKQEMEQKFRHEQQINSKKEQEIQRLRERAVDSDLSKALVAYLAKKEGTSVDAFEDSIKDDVPSLRKEYDEIRKRQEQERYSEKAQAVWDDVKASSLPKTEKANIYKALREGDIELAMLLKEEATPPKTEVKVEAKVEDKEAEFQKRLDEEKRKWMEQTGQLVTDAGGPTASSGKVYSIKEIDAMDYRELESKFGKDFSTEITKLAQSGKIK